MLFTLQAGLAAGQRAIPADQRVAQYPEARYWLAWMQQVRLDQWRDEQLADRLMKRCRWTYNVGIIAFISGLISLLIPAPGQWDDLYTGRAFRILALVAAVVALLIEIVLTFNKPACVADWLVPGIANIKPAKPEEVEGLDPIELELAQRLVFGDDGVIDADLLDVGSPAPAADALAPVLESLAARLEAFSQAVDRAITLVRQQADKAEAELARARGVAGPTGAPGGQPHQLDLWLARAKPTFSPHTGCTRRAAIEDKREETAKSPPLSAYSAPWGLRQDPGRAA